MPLPSPGFLAPRSARRQLPSQPALPARVLKPGLRGPVAPLLSRACTRAGGGSARSEEAKEGRTLPISRLQEVGWGRRRRDPGLPGRGRDETTAVRGAEPYPLQSVSQAPRPRAAPTAPSLALTISPGQQCGFPQTRASLLMPSTPHSLSRKILAGSVNRFLFGHQWVQDCAVPNHISCVYNCSRPKLVSIWVNAWDTEVLKEVSQKPLFLHIQSPTFWGFLLQRCLSHSGHMQAPGGSGLLLVWVTFL